MSEDVGYTPDAGYILTPQAVLAWQVGSGPMPWWVVDQEPCGPGAGKNYVKIRTYHGDVSAMMGDWIVKGLGRGLTVFPADDFAYSFLASDGSRPADAAAFDEAQRAKYREFFARQAA